MIRQAVVVAGGRGTRLGETARIHGNKALVPVGGAPLLRHTIDWLKAAGVDSIIVTVNYVAQLRRITALLDGETGVAVVGNTSRKNSAEVLPALAGVLDERFLFVYGHAPVPPEHLRAMFGLAQSGEVVTSIYPATSQREQTAKQARLHHGRVHPGQRGGVFIEPPHILNHAFFDCLRKSLSWKKTFLDYPEEILGVKANHPSEFHDREDLAKLIDWWEHRSAPAKTRVMRNRAR
jgi:molybdopterin-guanine dinucleotide biosynthesis protein A